MLNTIILWITGFTFVWMTMMRLLLNTNGLTSGLLFKAIPFFIGLGNLFIFAVTMGWLNI